MLLAFIEGIFIGFVAGIISTILFLRYLCVIRISVEKKSQKNNPREAKSPYSDINLMDTKYRDCG
ncbi:MAG TPA: hypothetical protein PK566_06235 [Pseudobacteroides sp.]|nr:hypothetical protein [Pseudobacteroides sp.]